MLAQTFRQTLLYSIKLGTCVLMAEESGHRIMFANPAEKSQLDTL